MEHEGHAIGAVVVVADVDVEGDVERLGEVDADIGHDAAMLKRAFGVTVYACDAVLIALPLTVNVGSCSGACPVLTVTASLKATVSVTTLPAFRLPLPFVIPAPDATTEETVGGVVSIAVLIVTV